MSKVICLTGGGTAGHVNPHLALLDEYQRLGWQVYYVGSKGIEKQIVKNVGLKFYQIQCGKLRRYFSWENFFDFFRVGIGFLQSLVLLLFWRPDLVFSKGGYVSVPVCLAAFVLRIPVFTHESDLTPGLANRIIEKVATKIFYSFPETQKYIDAQKGVYVGALVRKELFGGDPIVGRQICGFGSAKRKPTLLIMGGSLGAQNLNTAVASVLERLLEKFELIHLTGRGKEETVVTKEGYRSFDYVGDELKHLLAAADFVVSRAGANAIFEFLALRKPMLLVPLVAGSRGDQLDNARSFESSGYAKLLEDGELKKLEQFAAAIDELVASAPSIVEAQKNWQAGEAIPLIINHFR